MRKGEFFAKNVVMIRPLAIGQATDEDVIELIPPLVYITNIPTIMLGGEMLNRIFNCLGQPLLARAMEQHEFNRPPMLEAVVVIGKNFKYLSKIMIIVE